MTDTPRTDARLLSMPVIRSGGRHTLVDVVEIDFARQLEREAAAAKRDAERYRWLRDYCEGWRFSKLVSIGFPREKVDAAIDAAMKEWKCQPTK